MPVETAETGSTGSIRKWAGSQAAHLQVEADKPGPGIRSCSQLYETVSLHKLGQLILLLVLQASYETLAQSLQFMDEPVPDQDLDSAAQQQHLDEMSKYLHKHVLRRIRSEVSSFVPPRAEVVLPVMMTQRQRECYKAHLARAYDVLTDPKTPRQNSHRGGQLRAVCASLKKVRILLLMITSRGRQSNAEHLVSTVLYSLPYIYGPKFQIPDCLASSKVDASVNLRPHKLSTFVWLLTNCDL